MSGIIRKVRKRDGRVVDFDQERITNAIFAAAVEVGGRDRRIAERLSHEVVKILEEKYAGEIPSVEDIQDVVEKVLIEKGHARTAKAYILYRKQHEEMRKLKSTFLEVENIVDDYLGMQDWRVRENSNMGYSLSGLLFHVATSVVANYTLDKIYPMEIADAHTNGDMHIHDLGMGITGYSFYGDETVIIRRASFPKNPSLPKVETLSELFDFIPSQVVHENGFEIKYPPRGYQILDEDGWTPLFRVLRHKAKKPLLSFLTEDGHNIIVTEDHPFITVNGEKQDIRCPGCESRDLKKTRTRGPCKDGQKDYFKCKNCGKSFSVLVQKEIDQTRIEKLANEISAKNYTIVVSPRRLRRRYGRQARLGSELGWVIGFMLAEGWTNRGVFISVSKESPEYQKLVQCLQTIKCDYSEHLKESQATVRLKVRSLGSKRRWFVRKIAKMKKLPPDFLRFSDEDIGAILCGLIDGDGTVRVDDPWVSSVCLRMTNRALLEQIQFWLTLCGARSSLRLVKSYGERVYKGTRIVPKKKLYSLTFWVPERLGDMFKHSTKINRPGFKFSRREHSTVRKGIVGIKSITPFENDSEWVYDVTTASGTFVCNNVLVHNCAGWSLRQLLAEGFNGVPGKVASKPPAHLDTALLQMSNFVGSLQNEWAGAQAFNSCDTLLAPFVRKDNLSYRQVKQAMQTFVFNLNIASRWGGQTPFTNITLDLTVPEDLASQYVTIGGKLGDKTYAECTEEMEMINRALMEVMMEGDMNQRPFTFPIPTYSLTKDFEWDNGISSALFEMTAKYGLPYFQNFINSDLRPSDVRSMCCHLRLDLAELRRNVTGGLFGSSDSTGSVGVVTINMPRLGYLSKSEDEFFEKLGYVMELARISLETKREMVKKNMENGLLPFTKRYLGTLNNHFSTIGLVGMNEACLNLLGSSIAADEGKKFAVKTLKFMLGRIQRFQEETGNIYNLEATPAEGVSYRLAKIDKQKYPNIITAGEKAPYYTNSTTLPVNSGLDLITALKHQEELQTLYTGGTVHHIFLGESLEDGESCMNLVRKVSHNTRLPYFTVTPTYTICDDHGFIPGEYPKCPSCGKDTEVYSRVVGYYRPVKNFNVGKQEEFRQRIKYT